MQKGPVIGPLVICAVCYNESKLSFLKEIGVKDSKKLTPKKRSQLAQILKENCLSFEITVISVKEIDNREKNKITLNQLEEIKMVELINKLKPDIVYIDAVDVNEERYGKSISSKVKHKPKNIISKHRADDIYPIVSAASIIAKNKRDSLIEKLSQEYGNLGSGYPSDKQTIDFIRQWVKKNKKVPHFVRKSWETTKNIVIEEIGNKKITEFLD